jgi:tRNA A-37 threonylcarbamoyl transferase component Bud32
MPLNQVIYRPSVESTGWVEVNPVLAAGFAALGINTATGFLELPGEVVCGHPDRHVLRVLLPGFPTAFYLKRQHRLTNRERFRNRLDGFGWASRCGREAAILKELHEKQLPAPRWAAFGEDGRGRAFLLVEEVACTKDLRHFLADNSVRSTERAGLANRIGRLIAKIHDAGFSTPDLTAKHLLISADTRAVTPIDWQSADRGATVSEKQRIRSLATLHASVADELASPRERLRVLRSALGPGRLAELADLVEEAAVTIRERRSIRDQRQSVVVGANQRLVWLSGEEVCAIPEVAAVWPRPAVVAPFYGCEPGTLPYRLPNGQDGLLIRGRSSSPRARLWAWLRGRVRRSPGTRLGRILFHLERYGIPAPRLLAFGQRLTGSWTAEWFVLHTTPVQVLPQVLDKATAQQLGSVLRRLHDAGCRVTNNAPIPFGSGTNGVAVRDVTSVTIARRVTDRDRAHDLRSMLAALPADARSEVETGYQLREYSRDHHRPLQINRVTNTVEAR